MDDDDVFCNLLRGYVRARTLVVAAVVARLSSRVMFRWAIPVHVCHILRVVTTSGLHAADDDTNTRTYDMIHHTHTKRSKGKAKETSPRIKASIRRAACCDRESHQQLLLLSSVWICPREREEELQVRAIGCLLCLGRV